MTGRAGRVRPVGSRRSPPTAAQCRLIGPMIVASSAPIYSVGSEIAGPVATERHGSNRVAASQLAVGLARRGAARRGRSSRRCLSRQRRTPSRTAPIPPASRAGPMSSSPPAAATATPTPRTVARRSPAAARSIRPSAASTRPTSPPIRTAGSVAGRMRIFCARSARASRRTAAISIRHFPTPPTRGRASRTCSISRPTSSRCRR